MIKFPDKRFRIKWFRESNVHTRREKVPNQNESTDLGSVGLGPGVEGGAGGDPRFLLRFSGTRVSFSASVIARTDGEPIRYET